MPRSLYSGSGKECSNTAPTVGKTTMAGGTTQQGGTAGMVGVFSTSEGLSETMLVSGLTGASTLGTLGMSTFVFWDRAFDLDVDWGVDFLRGGGNRNFYPGGRASP